MADTIEFPEFSSLENDTFKKEVVIPYFKDIFKVSILVTPGSRLEKR